MARKDIRIAYYEKTEVQKKRCLYYRKRKILKSDNELLKTMVKIVEQDVITYHSDFYIHDTELIKEYEGDPFIWIVRKNGTHFVYLLSDEFTKSDEWDSYLYFNAILHNSGGEIKGIYLIENGKLQKLSKDKAFKVLNYYEGLMRRDLKKYA
jgi:hypothetical protein